jgi:hypothetical protein
MHKHGHAVTIIKPAQIEHNFLTAEKEQQFQMSVTSEHIKRTCYSITSWDNSISTISDNGLDGHDSVSSRGGEPLLCHNCPDQLWDPLSLLHNRKHRLFPQKQSSHKATTQISLPCQALTAFGAVPGTPYIFLVWCLNHKGHFTFHMLLYICFLSVLFTIKYQPSHQYYCPHPQN